VSRKLTTRMMKSRNAKPLHFGVSDTGTWRSQESRLFITGVPKLQNAKRRNPEIGTSTMTPFRSFGYRELEESRVETLHHRSPEVAKCETPKSRNRHINKDSISEFRRPRNQRSKERGSLTSRTRHMRNREIILVVGSRTNLGHQT
jgi:hypothetical protein